MDEKIRLNRFLAERLGWSRRQADDLIAQGRVRVNGQIARLGCRVAASDKVEVREKHWQPITETLDYIYLAMNKPIGYVCSRRSQSDTPTIYELLPNQYRQLKTVGRLDKDSAGLILLTNDGEFNYRMTHPKFAKHKVYEVELDRPLTPLHQQMISDFGVELTDGRSQLLLTKLTPKRKRWQVEMSEGRNRQIRRTFGALGYTVVSLNRIKFGPYKLSGLEPGEWSQLPKLSI